MKKVTFLILSLIFSATAFAQTDVNISADVVSPIVVAETSPMNFGKVSNNVAGSVVLDTNNNATGLAQVGTTSPTSGGFSVTAADGYTYTLTIPSSVLIKNIDNITMTVDTFTYTPGVTGNITGTGTAQNYKMGATLHVNATQATGQYAGVISVTANYN